MKNEMDERRFFSGKTVEQALMAAARHYQLEPERVAYSLRDKKQGFLRVGRRTVIEVDPSSPEKLAAKAEPPERTDTQDEGRDLVGSERESHDSEVVELVDAENAPKDELEAVDLSVKKLLHFSGLDLTWSLRRDEEVIEVELDGYDSERLAKGDGAVLQAMEHLIPRLVRGWVGRGVPCKVDCQGFQAAHERRLIEQARELAEQVLRAGEARGLEPMNPADRRIIHLALAEEPGVETESEGEGLFKRVRVYPV